MLLFTAQVEDCAISHQEAHEAIYIHVLKFMPKLEMKQKKVTFMQTWVQIQPRVFVIYGR